MCTAHVYVATSLDGYVARSNHELDWLPQEPVEGEDLGYERFMDSVDGLVMGRGTYEKVLSFGAWPYSKPVVVLSQSLSQSQVPNQLQGKLRILTDSPTQILQRLGDEGWKRAYVDGGRLVQAFLRDGLIEDLIITQIPVLIGEGISLFGSLKADQSLRLVSSQAFGSGMVQSHYSMT